MCFPQRFWGFRARKDFQVTDPSATVVIVVVVVPVAVVGIVAVVALGARLRAKIKSDEISVETKPPGKKSRKIPSN